MNRKELVDGKRQCILCKEYKELAEFELRGKTKYFRSCCKKCESKRVLQYGQLMKIRSVAYKGGRCVICKYHRCFRSLTFHHIDPSLKEFSPGKKKSLTWEKIKVELDKCVLLCANCHGEVHDGITPIPLTQSVPKHFPLGFCLDQSSENFLSSD